MIGGDSRPLGHTVYKGALLPLLFLSIHAREIGVRTFWLAFGLWRRLESRCDERGDPQFSKRVAL